MDDFDFEVLRALKALGPCSNAEIGRKIFEPSHRTYKSLGVLCKLGFASHPKSQVWQITARGHKFFEEAPTKGLQLASP